MELLQTPHHKKQWELDLPWRILYGKTPTRPMPFFVYIKGVRMQNTKRPKIIVDILDIMVFYSAMIVVLPFSFAISSTPYYGTMNHYNRG